MSIVLLHGTPPKQANVSNTNRLEAALQRFTGRCFVTDLVSPPQPQPDTHP